MDRIKDGNLRVISREGCSYCLLLKQYLDAFKIEYVLYDAKDFEDMELKEIFDRHAIKTYPAVFSQGKYLGGYKEVVNLYR